MAAITSAVIAIAGVILGWIAIEIACKPCLEKGREAMNRSLNPDYDPDDDDGISNDIRAPLNPTPDLQSYSDHNNNENSNTTNLDYDTSDTYIDASPSASIKAV